MLYYKFRNYEEFKELFGIQDRGGGTKSRKNKILLSYIKNKKLLHDAIVSGDYHLLHISSMAELKQTMTSEICRSGYRDPRLQYTVYIKDVEYRSAVYRTDEYEGICEDGDYRAIRYVHLESGRVFKMKTGKFYRKLILETAFGQTLPEAVLTYLCEEMAQDWQTYTMSRLPENTLCVDKDFRRIYDSEACAGNFNSCMTDTGYHVFYSNAVDASAAYLQNGAGFIVARCIIYNQVKDETGKIWRLAERQYASGGDEILKRALVDALLRGGYIDGYKQIGAGCADERAFVDVSGTSLSHLKFYIDCALDYGDTVSYQDSFKYYDIDRQRATNYGVGEHDLATTGGHLDNICDEYDSYHDSHCEEVEIVYYHGQEYTCDSSRLEDFAWLSFEDGYYHWDDVFECPHCHDLFLYDKSVYSELMDDYYCCPECQKMDEQQFKAEHWIYSEYDDAYVEDENAVTTYLRWSADKGEYEKSTVCISTLESLLERGVFCRHQETVYDRIDAETGLPFDISAGTSGYSHVA